MASSAREAPAPDLAPDGLPPAAAATPRVLVPRAPLLIAVAAAVAGAFLIAMLSATSGRFVPQVLDLYLIAQYAKSMAQGHPFQYYPGEAASTGATSLLHTALLALAHAAGARGEGLIAFAVLSGAVFYALTVLLAARIGARLAGPREGLLAGLLTALCGPVVWGFLYGADIALVLLLATWLLDRILAGWSREGRPDRGWPLAAALLALARPEGLVTALVLGIAYVLGPGRSLRRRGGWLPWAPTLAGVAVLVLYRLVTGSWVGTSVADKSLLANYTVADTVALVSDYVTDVIRGLLLGFYPSQALVGTTRGMAPFYFPPLALVFVLVAFAAARPPSSAALRAWAAATLATLAAVVPNTFLGVHFNRYLMWSFPALLALTAAGVGVVAARFAEGHAQRERPLFLAAGALFLFLGALSAARFAALYGETAGDIARRDVAAARWMRENLPPGTAVANLASGVEYLSGHRVVNLHGVTSAAFFGNRTAEREANTVEGLARLGPAQRPSHLITSEARHQASPVMRALVQEPPLYRTLSLSDELLVYRMRYEALDRAARPLRPETAAAVAGRALVDALNVCDAGDERAHDYRFRSRLDGLQLNGTARLADYPGGALVVDGGRAVFGWERFTVRSQPGREMVIVMRTASALDAGVLRTDSARAVGIEIALGTADVSIDGRPLGRLTIGARPGWDEVVLPVPAAAVTGATSRIELRGRYAAFRYWFYQ